MRFLHGIATACLWLFGIYTAIAAALFALGFLVAAIMQENSAWETLAHFGGALMGIWLVLGLFLAIPYVLIEDVPQEEPVVVARRRSMRHTDYYSN